MIEDRFSAGRPELELGGVQFRSDVAAFEAVKGRLSNAAHMMMMNVAAFAVAAPAVSQPPVQAAPPMSQTPAS